MLDYIRDGQEIYRRSFATIRAEADLARFDPDADVVENPRRVIHHPGHLPGHRVLARLDRPVGSSRGATLR